MTVVEPEASSKSPSLVSLNSEGLEALREFGVRATIKGGDIGESVISTDTAGDARLGVVKVYTRNLAAWQSFQPVDKITISIGVNGCYGGKINSRPYESKAGGLNFISMPNDEQKSTILSDETCGWLINFSYEQFQRECMSQMQIEHNIVRFGKELRGYESFLEGGAQHLLWLKNFPPMQWHAASIEATKAAMISFVAARITGVIGEIPVAPIKGACAAYVDATIAYMEQSYPLPLTLGDLCDVCHVSARTLQGAFNEFRGETPMQALRIIRLDRLRFLLIQGEDVASSCCKVGLSPTGRTASLYAVQFGEKPNQTSARHR